MTNKISDDALKELRDIVAGQSDGISAPDIAKCLSEDIPRRTLQYRLKQLVEIGLLRMSGSGRWAKYHLATSGKPVVGEQAQKDEDYGRLIRMSKEGKAVAITLRGRQELASLLVTKWIFSISTNRIPRIISGSRGARTSPGNWQAKNCSSAGRHVCQAHFQSLVDRSCMEL